jgi:hypothetical protein
VAIYAKPVDERLVSCDVPSSCTKGLCKCSHEDIDTPGVDAKVVCNTTAVRAKSTNGMGFVDEQVELPQNVRKVQKKRNEKHTLYFFLSSKIPGRLTSVPSIL